MTELERWIRGASEWEFGGWGERLWSNIFASCGMSYMPLHTASTMGAPMLMGREKIISPDFHVAEGRVNIYVDSKAKRHPITYRNAKELRHGCDTKNLEHYQDFARRMRNHCAIAIFEAFLDESNEKWSGHLLIQTMPVLERCKCPGIGSTKDKMTYWPRTAFSVLGVMPPEEASRTTWARGAGERFREAILEALYVSQPVQGILS